MLKKIALYCFGLYLALLLGIYLFKENIVGVLLVSAILIVLLLIFLTIWKMIANCIYWGFEKTLTFESKLVPRLLSGIISVTVIIILLLVVYFMHLK